MFKGKAIYNPSGKAGEYSYWACNFYVGCSNGCEYCYCKKGILKNVMGQNKPQLKKCFADEAEALSVFYEEMVKNLSELQKHGLFFSFTTDPMLKETYGLTLSAVYLCREHGIPVKILTKSTIAINAFIHESIKYCFDKSQISVGFTLTGHDELEQNASTNDERIAAMKKLHGTGFKTFASIEPIIDLDSSMKMICDSIPYCDLYKVGLMAADKSVSEKWLACWVATLKGLNSKFYIKQSIRSYLGKYYDQIEANNFVERDYNIFE